MSKRDDLLAALRALADRAVSEGRCNWDSYFGHDNSMHLEDLEEWPEHKAVMALLERECAK